MPRIEITIYEDGRIEMDGKGFKGKACEKAMKPLEEALGKVTRHTKKPEYTQTNKEGQKGLL